MARRLILVLLLPLLIGGGFAFAFTYEALIDAQDQVQAGLGADLALSLGGLVEGLETEAIVSVRYSIDDLENAAEPADPLYRGLSLNVARDITDQRLELAWRDFRETAADYPLPVQDSIGAALATVETALGSRPDIDERLLDTTRIADRYTYVSDLVIDGMVGHENAASLRDLVGEVAAYTALVDARNDQLLEYLTVRSELSGETPVGSARSELEASRARQDHNIDRAKVLLADVDAVAALGPNEQIVAIRDDGLDETADPLTIENWDRLTEDWRSELDAGVGAARRFVQFPINQGEANVWATFRRRTAVNLTIGLLTAFTSGFVAWLVHQRIRGLRNEMERVARSEIDLGDVAEGVRGSDEIRDIAVAFDRINMRVRRAHSLQRREAEILERIARAADLDESLVMVASLATEQLDAPFSITRDDPATRPIRPAVSYAMCGHRNEDMLGWLVSDYDTPVAQVEHRDRVLATCAGLGSAAIELDRTHEQQTYQSTHDELTGLSNIQALMLEVDRLLSDPELTQIAVLRVSLDGLKDINDKYDRSVGDNVLIDVANRLRQAVGSGGILARAGGGEFVVKAAGMPSEASAVELALRIIDSIDESFQVGTGRVSLKATIGLALSERGHDAAVLLRNAELAHYRAKATATGGFEVYEDELGRWATERVETGDALQVALDEDQIEVWFQPIFGTGGGLAGFEGLMRWNRPDHGIVSPAVFLPIAEESGLVVGLGRHVLEKGCRQLAEWHALKPDSSVFLSLNASAAELRDPANIRYIADVLERTGAPPERLVIEVSESVLVEHEKELVPRLKELDSLGVHLAIDNFGSGHSSLTYLRELPIDLLKIDRSFISEAPKSEEVSAIVSTIVGLADAMGMTVVAEGVEDPEQLRTVKALGVALSQGYLLGRPMTAFAATRIWEEQAS